MSNFLSLLTLFGLILSGGSFAKATSPSSRTVTMNDVSILLGAHPVQGFGEPPHLDFDFNKINHLPIFGQNPNKEQSSFVRGLINESIKKKVFDTFEKLPGDEPLSFPQRAIVLGLRLDPCSNSHKNNAEQCIPQLRLVAEEPDLEDRSVHLIYNFSETDFKTLLLDMKKLNDSCGKIDVELELSTHPCSRDPVFLNNFNQLVLKHATNKRLKKVAFQIRTSDNPLGVFWIFATAELKAGVWGLIKTEFAPKGEEFFAFGKDNGHFSDLNLGKLDKEVVKGLRGELDEKEVDSLVSLLENTVKVRVDNTSCMSCHASPALRSKFESLRAATPSYFQLSELERALSQNAGSADIRHFGYRFGVPKISNRVLIETRQAVNFLNQKE